MCLSTTVVHPLVVEEGPAARPAAGGWRSADELASSPDDGQGQQHDVRVVHSLCLRPKQKRTYKMTDTDDEEIDDEQVEDYCTMLDKLGRHPDKVAIVSLSRSSYQ